VSTTDRDAEKKQGSGGGGQGRDETPQLPGLEILLSGNMEEFISKMMGQHYVLSYGDNTALLSDCSRPMKIDAIS
jgi:hypothetical protein